MLNKSSISFNRGRRRTISPTYSILSRCVFENKHQYKSVFIYIISWMGMYACDRIRTPK